MDTTTLLVIVLVVLALGGGGWFYHVERKSHHPAHIAVDGVTPAQLALGNSGGMSVCSDGFERSR